MEIKIDSGDILQSQSELAVLGCYADVSLPPSVATLLEPGDFKGLTGRRCCSTRAEQLLQKGSCSLVWENAKKRPRR